jgi:hypothetical protein
VNPDAADRTRRVLAGAEQQLLLDATRAEQRGAERPLVSGPAAR